MLVMTQRGKTFSRQNSMIWVELSFEFLVCLNSVLKVKLGGYESTWNENINANIFWTNLLRLHSFFYKAPKQKTISKMSKIQNRHEISVIKFLECSKVFPQVREYYNPIRVLIFCTLKCSLSLASHNPLTHTEEILYWAGSEVSKILASGRYFGVQVKLIALSKQSYTMFSLEIQPLQFLHEPECALVNHSHYVL